MAALRDRCRGGEGAPPPWLGRPAPAVLARLPGPAGSRVAGQPGPAGPSRIAPSRNRWTGGSDSTIGSGTLEPGADLADPTAELALAERPPHEPRRSGQVRHHRLAFGRVGVLQDHAEKEQHLVLGDFFGEPLAQARPLRHGEMLLDGRQDVLLLIVKMLEQRVAVLGERTDERGV